MAPAQYVLECRIDGVAARVCVNDVPVLLREGPESVLTAVPLNPWLSDATTEIVVDVAGALEDDALRGSFEATLVARRIGEPPADVAHIRVPSEEIRDHVVRAAGGWQIRRTLSLPDLDRPPSAFWPGAEPFVLRDADRASIVELVTRLQRSLDVMDTDTLHEVLAFQHADMARALHVTEDQVHDHVASMLIMGLGDADLDLDIDPMSEQGLAHLDETIDLHMVARDRLVWVTRDRFAPPLWVPAVKPKIRLQLYLAPVGGQWTVVR